MRYAIAQSTCARHCAAQERIVRGLKRRPVLTALSVLGALLLLVIASDSFTNAVEWIGALYGLTRSAVGAVVAAIGSSLPETMVAVVALVILRDPASQAVGIGAVLGAPFMLATVVFAIIGAFAYVRGTASAKTGGTLAVDPQPAIVGLSLFTLTFAFVVGASFAPTLVVRTSAAIAVVIAYAAYLVYHFKRAEPESDEKPPPLRFAPAAAKPHAWIVFAQMAVALAVTIGASRWFVSSVAAVSLQLGLAPLVVSLLLSPIATELPEAMNVVIWMRQGKDELAVGNVIGAMMFQTSIASAIALLASPWRLDAQAYVACGATAVAVVLVLTVTAIRGRVNAWTLTACSLFYLGYLLFAGVVR
jgi:cation:H+ antiporter